MFCHHWWYTNSQDHLQRKVNQMVKLYQYSWIIILKPCLTLEITIKTTEDYEMRHLNKVCFHSKQQPHKPEDEFLSAGTSLCYIERVVYTPSSGWTSEEDRSLPWSWQTWIFKLCIKPRLQQTGTADKTPTELKRKKKTKNKKTAFALEPTCIVFLFMWLVKNQDILTGTLTFFLF